MKCQKKNCSGHSVYIFIFTPLFFYYGKHAEEKYKNLTGQYSLKQTLDMRQEYTLEA